jgi:uncharacterized protein (DUF433 family)
MDIHVGGNPAIAGTHVTVEEVLKESAAWGTIERIRTMHDILKRCGLHCTDGNVPQSTL